MLEMMGTTHCFFTDEKDNTTQPKNGLCFLIVKFIVTHWYFTSK